MNTAGRDGNGQPSSTGFAIPINTALSIARQIAGGHASSTTTTIGYPPFVGILTGSGPGTSPQAQAQQQNGGFGSGTGNTQQCYSSNSDLNVPSVIAPARYLSTAIQAAAGGWRGRGLGAVLAGSTADLAWKG